RPGGPRRVTLPSPPSPAPSKCATVPSGVHAVARMECDDARVPRAGARGTRRLARAGGPLRDPPAVTEVGSQLAQGDGQEVSVVPGDPVPDAGVLPGGEVVREGVGEPQPDAGLLTLAER